MRIKVSYKGFNSMLRVMALEEISKEDDFNHLLDLLYREQFRIFLYEYADIKKKTKYRLLELLSQIPHTFGPPKLPKWYQNYSQKIDRYEIRTVDLAEQYIPLNEMQPFIVKVKIDLGLLHYSSDAES